MKQVVTDRKINASESTFNTKFMEFADYYGIVVRLCYPYRSQTKGKIENTIKYLRYNFFNGRTFSDKTRYFNYIRSAFCNVFVIIFMPFTISLSFFAPLQIIFPELNSIIVIFGSSIL